MNIVHLIGNGFDINLGLKTKFRHFYDYYLKQETKFGTIIDFKNELDKNKDIEDWADLELVLGRYAEHFSNKTVLDFRKLLIDIQDNLANYLKTQEIKFELSEEDLNKVNEDLFFPNKYLNQREKAHFMEYKNTYDLGTYGADIITFNYTDTISKMYEYSGKNKQLGVHTFRSNNYSNILNSIEHIHGTTSSNMILGINDVSQLQNEELRKNIKAIRSIVKSEMNKNAGTLRDERCFNLIKGADIICIFGMSLGETDAIWWQAINNKLLNSNATLIIFAVNQGTPEIRDFLSEDDKDDIRNKLLSYSSFSVEQKNNISNRIFVRLNSEMFSISSIQKKVVA